MLAHLTWQEIRQPTQARVLRRAAEGLISGYEHRAGAVDRERLAWWHATCLVQVAARRYRRLEVQDWPALAQLAHAAQEVAGSHTRSNGSGSHAGLPRPPADGRGASPGLFSLDNPGSVQVELADELATAAGRRTSVRFLVQREGGAEPLAVVAKAFSDAPRATLLWTHLRLLHAGPFGTARCGSRPAGAAARAPDGAVPSLRRGPVEPARGRGGGARGGSRSCLGGSRPCTGPG